MKTLFTLLLITVVTISAQTRNYRELGSIVKPGATAGVSYLIDLDSVKRTGDEVKFTGVIVAFAITPEGRELIPGYRLESQFEASCKTYIWSEVSRKGQWGEKDGKPDIRDEKNLVTGRKAENLDPITTALDTVCKPAKLSA